MAKLQRASLGDTIADLLRVQIVRGELPLGAHLAEPQLAAEFDVSRAPVREALLQLEAEGLVSTVKNKVFVVGLSDDAIEELYSLRLTLELMAIKRAIGTSSDEAWLGAERHIDEMQAAADASDPTAFAAADLAFHDYFYAASHHSRLFAIWKLYEKTFAALLDVTNHQDSDLGPAVEVHRDLLAAARSGDQELIQERVTAHMDGSRERLTKAVREVHGNPHESQQAQ